MKHWKILTAVLVISVMATGAGFMALRSGQAEEAGPARAPATVDVTRGSVQQTVVAPGRVVGTGEVLLGMAVGGQLDEITVRPGSVVKAQNVLARLDTGPLEEALEAARREQARQLVEGAGPLPTGEVKRAEADLASASLVAPFDGVVLDVTARPGETVSPGMGFMLLANPSAVEVRTTVIEEDLPLVQVGQAVELFFDAQPDAALEERVVRIVPRRVPGENRPLYHVYISLDKPPEGVVSGMTADASIIVAQRSDVLRLPRAVVRGPSGGTARVKVWANGQLEPRTVKVGLRGDVNVEIVEGLSEGDMVVAE